MTTNNVSKKEPVRLRERHLANGNISLYLDIYRDGKRQREFLKLYLIQAKTPAEREQNRQSLATAQAIKAKRQIELQNGEYSFTQQFKEDTPFLEYYRNMCEERHKQESKSNWGNWRSCLKYLEIYCDEKTTFRDVTPAFVKGFKEFLDTVEKDTHKRTVHAERDVFLMVFPIMMHYGITGALLACIVLPAYDGTRDFAKGQITRYGFYLFYPLHLFVILLFLQISYLS